MGAGHSAALALLYRAHVAIGDPAADAGWPWPAPRLSYASGAIAEAVIVSGHYLGDDRLLRKGLRMLEWLLAAETRDGHLSVVSRQGWSRGDAAAPPASGQRPAEVAALADACVRAATVTADDSWLASVRMCLAWFLGDNDAKVPLVDERTGGCSDGLTGAGRSRNQRRIHARDDRRAAARAPHDRRAGTRFRRPRRLASRRGQRNYP